MRVVLQRVSSAEVRVEKKVVGSIGAGMLLLLGVRKGDTEEDAYALAKKCSLLRVFSDPEGKMNLSVRDVDGAILVVSQFTLYGDTRKGTRPSYSDAADATTAERLYGRFCSHLRDLLGTSKVETGVFGAMMDVALVNDGPVTVILDVPVAGKSA